MKEIKNNTGPLRGWKIVDMSRVLGGPYCTQLLGDLGASIVKIEPPQGDETRDWGPPFQEEEAAYFIGINRNKKSIALDMTKPQSKTILLRLLEDAGPSRSKRDRVVQHLLEQLPEPVERSGVGAPRQAGRSRPQALERQDFFKVPAGGFAATGL